MLQDSDYEDSTESSDCSFLSDENISTFAVLKGPSPVLKLCNRCVGLQLDDKALGGTVNEHLHMRSLHYGAYFGSCRFLGPLTYSLKDTLPELPALTASVASGCSFCVLVKDALLGQHSDTAGDINIFEAAYRLAVDRVSQDNQFGMRYTRTEPPLNEQEKDLDLRVKRHPLDALVMFYTVTGGEDHTFGTLALRFDISTEATDLCTRWLNVEYRPIAAPLSDFATRRCKEMVEESERLASTTHRAARTETYLPTRLIEVRKEGEDPRLVESRDHSPLINTESPLDARYAALTYCWGTREEAQYQLKTEIHSLAARFAGIEFGMLPATIRDAVLVCRSMGIRYLWVDALCIIQGDKTDWEKESPQMASVYRNAHFAICAAQGTSCVSGFLQRQVPHQVKIPFTSMLDSSISGSLSFSVGCQYPPSEEHKSTFPGYPRPAIERRPEESLLAIMEDVAWNTRTWTFQEARISKRLLVFGSRMVYLIDEQRQVVVAEDGLTSHTRSMYPSYQSIITGGPGTSMFRTRIWYQMMAEYSRRIITYSMDRLPAISAVAHTFSTLMSGEYLAGFWNDETFCDHLLWYQVVPPVYSCAGKTEMENEKGTEEYVAPSWSWLSVFPRERASEDARGVDWLFQEISLDKRRESWTPLYLSHRILVDDSDPEGNPYGRIKRGAALMLSAKVYTPLSGVEVRSWADLLDGEMQQLVEEQYRCSHTLWIDGQYLARASLDWMPASGDADVGCESSTRRQLAQGVALMAVAYDNPEHQHRSTRFAEKKRRVWTDALHGLVLMPIELPHGEPATNGYQRVGIFSSDALFDGLGGMAMWENIEPSVVVLV